MPQTDATLPVIVPTNSGALTTTTGPQRIATRMAENLLGVARSQERALAAQRRYRIGDYEFREADHAQIQRWARRLGMGPEAVVEGLARIWTTSCGGDFDVCIQDGAIDALMWDFDLFPLNNWDWVAGLKITCLGILNAPNKPLPNLPECLSCLECSGWFNKKPLTSLQLCHAPALERLDCFQNQLTDLDLTPVPRLKVLWCCYNELTTLDLTPVPGLGRLDCSHNELTQLDLTPVQGLRWLNCDRKVKIRNAPQNLEVSYP